MVQIKLDFGTCPCGKQGRKKKGKNASPALTTGGKQGKTRKSRQDRVWLGFLCHVKRTLMHLNTIFDWKKGTWGMEKEVYDVPYKKTRKP